MARWAEEQATEELGYRAQGDAVEAALKWGFAGALLSLLAGPLLALGNAWYADQTTMVSLWFAFGGAAAGGLRSRLRDRRWDRRVTALKNAQGR